MNSLCIPLKLYLAPCGLFTFFLRYVTMRIMEQQKDNFTLAFVFMIFSSLGFAAMGLFVNLTGPIPAIQKVFFRNIVVFCVSLIFLLHQLDRREIANQFKNSRNLVFLLLRTVLGTLAVVGNFYAASNMPIASASVLNKLSPFFTVIFSALFLKEEITATQLLCILLAFFGVACIAQPGADTFNYIRPFMSGTLGGISAGAAYTCVHYLTGRKMHPAFLVCVFHGLSTLLILPLVLINFKPMTTYQLLMIFATGCSAFVGQYGLTLAYKFSTPSKVSIFDYSTVVFSIIFGIVFLSQIPGISSIIGMGIVFVAFLVMFLTNRKKETNKTKR